MTDVKKKEKDFKMSKKFFNVRKQSGKGGVVKSILQSSRTNFLPSLFLGLIFNEFH